MTRPYDAEAEETSDQAELDRLACVWCDESWQKAKVAVWVAIPCILVGASCVVYGCCKWVF